ncbi:MAG: type II toxin-antitoxin system RelE/ParE family toxin [Anaerolineae bacterium]
MKWQVEFYTDARGSNPVLEFLNGLANRERAKAFRVLKLLQEYGTLLAMPHALPIERGLWELRAGASRIFYFTYIDRRLIILHGYLKKSQRTPVKEMKTALKRMSEFKERNK